ncbi:hypothetical protein BV96_03427 [Sphingomonas paucimobilis]|nr:hypothetical protein BV96_03427 [Sphingomonas paucimobilis]
MMDWSSLVALIGNLAILIAGVRVLAMSGEAPQREAMPLVMTKDDLEQHNGVLRVRQVFLFFGGAGIIIVALCRLGN